MLELNLAKTAVVFIDLQQNILNAAPLYPSNAKSVIAANDRLSQAFKNTPALEVLVSVQTETFQHLYPFPAEKRHLANAEQPKLLLPIAQDPEADNVIQVTKHNPGAFFGTDLDLQLRRQGIDTIILAGVSTSNGVYATALDAFQYAYHVIVIEDACADRDLEKHDFFFTKMFDRIADVVSIEEIVPAVERALS
ncbi:isochorismatase family protein [Lacticaseibacillus porcinae]|uniref:isochorismatase family protein n=1 Tax=Lacticaseibacillus porcinae TaxID=1123687 RepID=UPI000F797CD6|nr:isochorismatase family protein [Lacticaseibacillus porcinae]